MLFDLSEMSLASSPAWWREELERLSPFFATSAQLAFANECASLVYLAAPKFHGEFHERAQIGTMPCPRKVPGELVRTYLDVPDNVTLGSVPLAPLRALIEPFIRGVGKIFVHGNAEGFVIRLADSGTGSGAIYD